MNRRGLLNILLLIAVLALSAVVYFAPGSDRDEGVSLTDIDRDSVERIVVVSEGEAGMTLERRDRGWEITRPMTVPAQDFAVRRLLGVLNEQVGAPLEATSTGAERKFGLDSPQAVIEFDGTPIAFGAVNPIENRRYVKTGGEIFLIPDAHLFTLERGVYGLISTKLLPPGASVTALRSDSLEIKRGGPTGWQLVSPSSSVSADQIVTLAQRWEQANALRVAAMADDAPEPGRSLRVELKDGQALDFAIVAEQPELILARPDLGIAYHLPASQSEHLLSLPEPVTPDPPRPE